MGPVVEGIGIVVHHHRVGVDAVALADADDLAVEGHLIVGLGHVVSLCLSKCGSRHDGWVVD